MVKHRLTIIALGAAGESIACRYLSMMGLDYSIADRTVISVVADGAGTLLPESNDSRINRVRIPLRPLVGQYLESSFTVDSNLVTRVTNEPFDVDVLELGLRSMLENRVEDIRNAFEVASRKGGLRRLEELVDGLSLSGFSCKTAGGIVIVGAACDPLTEALGTVIVRWLGSYASERYGFDRPLFTGIFLCAEIFFDVFREKWQRDLLCATERRLCADSQLFSSFSVVHVTSHDGRRLCNVRDYCDHVAAVLLYWATNLDEQAVPVYSQRLWVGASVLEYPCDEVCRFVELYILQESLQWWNRVDELWSAGGWGDFGFKKTDFHRFYVTEFERILHSKRDELFGYVDAIDYANANEIVQRWIDSLGVFIGVRSDTDEDDRGSLLLRQICGQICSVDSKALHNSGHIIGGRILTIAQSVSGLDGDSLPNVQLPAELEFAHPVDTRYVLLLAEQSLVRRREKDENLVSILVKQIGNAFVGDDACGETMEKAYQLQRDPKLLGYSTRLANVIKEMQLLDEALRRLWQAISAYDVLVSQAHLLCDMLQEDIDGIRASVTRSKGTARVMVGTTEHVLRTLVKECEGHLQHEPLLKDFVHDWYHFATRLVQGVDVWNAYVVSYHDDDWLQGLKKQMISSIDRNDSFALCAKTHIYKTVLQALALEGQDFPYDATESSAPLVGYGTDAEVDCLVSYASPDVCEGYAKESAIEVRPIRGLDVRQALLVQKCKWCPDGGDPA